MQNLRETITGSRGSSGSSRSSFAVFIDPMTLERVRLTLAAGNDGAREETLVKLINGWLYLWVKACPPMCLLSK